MTQSVAERSSVACPGKSGIQEAGKALSTGALASVIVLSSLLYVYRFAFAGVNVAAFRIVLMTWAAIVAAGILAGAIRWRRDSLPAFALLSVLAAVNVADLSRTDDLTVIGRDAVVHLVNLMLVALVLTTVQDRQTLNRWLAALVWTSIVPLAISGFTFATGRLPLEEELLSHLSEMVAIQKFTIHYESTLRLAAAFYDPNFYGIYLVQVTAVSIWLYPRTRYRSMLGLLIALNAIAIVFTLSRTAWVGLAVLTLILLASLPQRKFGALAICGGVLLITTLLILSLSDGGGLSGDLVARLSDAASTIDRLDYLANGWRAFSDAPWIGSGSEGLLTERFTVASAHNVYLSWLAKFGAFGTLPYLAFLFGPLLLHHVALGQDFQMRGLTTRVVVPLSVMYLAYDAFAFLEFQYLIFGLLWVSATLRPGERVATAREMARDNKTDSL